MQWLLLLGVYKMSLTKLSNLLPKFCGFSLLILENNMWYTPCCYSGYWHGNVEVHARRSSDSELRASVVADLNMLTSIRHENIQLFLGVCDDLHSDHLSIVME